MRIWRPNDPSTVFRALWATCRGGSRSVGSNSTRQYQARHRRRAKNRELRQGTLPLEGGKCQALQVRRTP